MTSALFAVRKLLEALLSPLVLSLVLIAFGLLRRRRALAAIGLLVLFVSSLPAVSNPLCWLVEGRYPRLRVEQCPQADAVVALSGFAGMEIRFPGELHWNSTVDRFNQAVNLVLAQKAPVLLLTDDESAPADQQGMMEILRQAALQRGLRPDQVHFTRAVKTTADEAQAIKAYLPQIGGHRIILLTSALHMPRAAYLFQRAGVDFTPFPVDYESDPWEWHFRAFTPTVAALSRTDKTMHEIWGAIFYHVIH